MIAQAKTNIIRQELIEVAGNYQNAILLDVLINKTITLKDYGLYLKENNTKKYGWLEIDTKELIDEILIVTSQAAINKYLKELETNNIIDRSLNKLRVNLILILQIINTKKIPTSLPFISDVRLIDFEYQKSKNKKTNNKKGLTEDICKQLLSEEKLDRHIKNALYKFCLYRIERYNNTGNNILTKNAYDLFINKVKSCNGTVKEIVNQINYAIEAGWTSIYFKDKTKNNPVINEDEEMMEVDFNGINL